MAKGIRSHAQSYKKVQPTARFGQAAADAILVDASTRHENDKQHGHESC